MQIMTTKKPKLGYISIKQQIDLLRRMGLNIPSDNTALSYLNEVGYAKLITCYKWPFWTNGAFVLGTTIDDLYKLYCFDCNLRSLLLKSIFTIEMTMKVQMADVISQYLGLDAKDYLNTKFYRDLKSFDINGNVVMTRYLSLKKHIENTIVKNSEQRSIKYHQKQYNKTPFWALSNILSFGDVNGLFSHLRIEYQSRVAKYWRRDHKFLISALNVVRMFRNACAHNETIFNYKTFGYRLNSSAVEKYLKYFNITNVDAHNHYVRGTNDLLSIFFIFKIMLSKTKFKEFVDRYLSITKNLPANVVAEIGVPSNIKDLLSLDESRDKN